MKRIKRSSHYYFICTIYEKYLNIIAMSKMRFRSDSCLIGNTMESKSESITRGQDLPLQPQFVTQSQLSIVDTQLAAMMTICQTRFRERPINRLIYWKFHHKIHIDNCSKWHKWLLLCYSTNGRGPMKLYIYKSHVLSQTWSIR